MTSDHESHHPAAGEPSRRQGHIVFACCLMGLTAIPACTGPQRPDWIARDNLDQTIQRDMVAGSVPGAVVCIGRDDEICYLQSFGFQVSTPSPEPMAADTIFDIASLTKPLATAPSILILMDRGQLSLQDRVSKYLPEFAAEQKDDVRIAHLLTHTSGLPAYMNAATLEAQHGAVCPDAVIEAICRLRPLQEPGREFRYSCLGYIVLARIVEIVSSQPLDEFARQNIYEPLGMSRTMFCPPPELLDQIAATEYANNHLLRGRVHDPLARLMDGVSGNAGLFSTAEDLATYCTMLLNGGTCRGRQILSAHAIDLLTTAQSHGRAYGFDVDSSYAWIKGSHASDRAFCHSGYTGTSLVCDPESGKFVIILTNRVHPDDSAKVRSLRTAVADLALGALAAARSN